MTSRLGGVLAMVLTAIVAGACTVRSVENADDSTLDDQAVDGAAENGVVEGNGADIDLLLEQGVVDAVIRMNPPTRAAVPADFGREQSIVGSRPILSVATPGGPADMFELRMNDPNMGPGLQRCLVIIERMSSSASCAAVNAPVAEVIGFGGASGNDDGTLYEFVGPADMTHLIVTVGGERSALITREGHGLIFVDQGHCENPPVIDSAWRGQEELALTMALTC